MQPQVEGQLSVQMYSLTQIPNTLRVSFELPGDPYDTVRSISDAGKAYLKELGVFFYRDEVHQHGVIIEADDEADSVRGRLNFPAYYYHGILHFDTLKIVEWTTADDTLIKKKGDDKAWLKWGDSINILEFDQLSLRCT